MKSIAIAGSILVDRIKEVSSYPKAGELAPIRRITRSVGGCVPNVAIDLKTLSPDITVKASGLVGCDDDGAFVKDSLARRGIDVSAVIARPGLSTSFTDVMSVRGGERTFFTYAGACAEFGSDTIDLASLGCERLHLGYFLLLDKIDAGDGVKILAAARERGIRTSIDLVSEAGDRYRLVRGALPFVDDLVVNELEAGRLVGIEPERGNLRAIAEALRKLGVKGRVIIHQPELGVVLGPDGFTVRDSIPLPRGYVKGKTGAGDAFCAGALTAMMRGADDDGILELAEAAAVASLSCSDATSGISSVEAVMKNFNRIGGTRVRP